MVQLYGYTCEFLAHCTRTVGTVWVRGHGDVLVMVIAGDGYWYGVQCVVPKCVSLHCWAVWARGDFRDGGKRRRRRGYSPAGTRFHAMNATRAMLYSAALRGPGVEGCARL